MVLSNPSPQPRSSGMSHSGQPPAPCYHLLAQAPTAPSLPRQPECTCPTQCMWKLGPRLYYGLKPTAMMHALGTVPLAHRLGDKFQIARSRYDTQKMLKQKYFVCSIFTRNSHAASLSSPFMGSVYLVSCFFMLTYMLMIWNVFFHQYQDSWSNQDSKNGTAND